MKEIIENIFFDISTTFVKYLTTSHSLSQSPLILSMDDVELKVIECSISRDLSFIS